jgi:hypothetical protein
MKIEDLLMSSLGLGALGAPPEMNPLTETDALQEAQLLGVRFDALSLTAGLLFELRIALQFARGEHRGAHRSGSQRVVVVGSEPCD